MSGGRTWGEDKEEVGRGEGGKGEKGGGQRAKRREEEEEGGRVRKRER